MSFPVSLSPLKHARSWLPCRGNARIVDDRLPSVFIAFTLCLSSPGRPVLERGGRGHTADLQGSEQSVASWGKRPAHSASLLPSVKCQRTTSWSLTALCGCGKRPGSPPRLEAPTWKHEMARPYQPALPLPASFGVSISLGSLMTAMR